MAYNTVIVFVALDVLPAASLNTNFANLDFLKTQVDTHIGNGRLTLETAVAISTTDQLAKTTVYFTPFRGNRIGLKSGTSWDLYSFTEKSVSLAGATADLPHDIFGYLSAGVLAIEKLAWTNTTTRATGLTLDDGKWVKSGDATRRYLGTICTTATIGQCEDSASRRLVWNYFNRVKRPFVCKDTTNSWTYTTATWRAANADTSYGVGRVGLVVGLSEDVFHAQATGSTQNSAAVVDFAVGIGINSTTVNSAEILGAIATNTDFTPVQAVYQNLLSIGFSYIQRLEISEAAGVTTWYGDNGVVYSQTGMMGSIRM